MKLSEAILLGSLAKPQGFVGTGHPDGATTCAFGAALYAVGGQEVVKCWPWLTTLVNVKCPACETTQWSYGIIPHLNNFHRWTRERIADWVATIEPQEPATSESPVTSDTFTFEGSREEVQTNG